MNMKPSEIFEFFTDKTTARLVRASTTDMWEITSNLAEVSEEMGDEEFLKCTAVASEISKRAATEIVGSGTPVEWFAIASLLALEFVNKANRAWDYIEEEKGKMR